MISGQLGAKAFWLPARWHMPWLQLISSRALSALDLVSAVGGRHIVSALDPHAPPRTAASTAVSSGLPKIPAPMMSIPRSRLQRSRARPALSNAECTLRRYEAKPDGRCHSGSPETEFTAGGARLPPNIRNFRVTRTPSVISPTNRSRKPVSQLIGQVEYYDDCRSLMQYSDNRSFPRATMPSQQDTVPLHQADKLGWLCQTQRTRSISS